MTILHGSTHRGDVIYLKAVRWPVNCFARSRSMFNLTLSSYFESTGKLIMHTYWTSMLWSINSCQNRVSTDQYHLTLLRAQVSTRRVQVFFGVIRWQVTSFQMIADSSLIFFKFICNMSCISAAQLKFWFQTDLRGENSASHYKQGRQLLLTLLTMITRSSHSSSHFYAVIGQNLTGEFMRKIYAVSWILFTLTVEADRVLSQLVMSLTVFIQCMYKMKFSCYQESSVIHG